MAKEEIADIETVHYRLYRYTSTGEWSSLKSVLEDHPEAINTKITHNNGTMLHLAIETDKKMSFLRNLLAYMNSKQYHGVLRMTNDDGDTALHYAASFGNIEAAKLLVTYDLELPNIWNYNSLLPLHQAAKSAQREVFTYLLGSTKDIVDQSPFKGDQGIMLVKSLVKHGFCDLALQLVIKYTHLATARESLHSIACHPKNFLSGTNYNQLQTYAYASLPVNSSRRDETSLRTGILQIIFVAIRSLASQGLSFLFSSQFVFLVFTPLVMRGVQADKRRHQDSIKLLDFICRKLQTINHDVAQVTIQNAAKVASRNGIHEIIEAIIINSPNALFLKKDDTDIGIFHIAVKHRQHKVFNLISQLGSQREALLAGTDMYGNTILHFAAKLPSSDRLNLAYGAALQMQRELLWYKAVENFVPAWVRDCPNKADKKPTTVFTEQHKDLMKDGEKWMRETANSFTIVAALISTITFAAAATVPGGYNTITGFPIFSKQIAFRVFAVANVISLFSSLISLLIFLALQTARYAEEDFLSFLPINLIVALVTLIISVLDIIVTFGATIYLVYSQKSLWVLIVLSSIGYLMVLVFVIYELPLLKGIYDSTFSCRKTATPFL